MPTRFEWADEAERMKNINLHIGCPHGRLGPCYACDQLNMEAQAMLDEGGPVFDSGETIPEGGEFDD